jgi:hypothetical protein
MRKPKYYPVEERRFNVENNLQCSLCGNTTAFCIDLRLKHLVEVEAGMLIVQIQRSPAERVFDSISRNIWRMIDKAHDEGKEIIRCANCHESETVDLQERLLDYCWQMDCPGCEVCGNYITEEEVRELCCECIKEHDGQITEDDCWQYCPHYDDSLLPVLEHYHLTLEDLLRELGY